MSYIDGFVITVHSAIKQKFIAQANKGDSVFIDHGATRVVACWGPQIVVSPDPLDRDDSRDGPQ